jgi:DNA-binding SARP family transcriptional activator
MAHTWHGLQRTTEVEPLSRTCLAEGNLAEALRHYSTFLHRLRDELGVAPSEQLHQLIATIREPRFPIRRSPGHPHGRR